jgi:segregation and condensation protein B
MDKLHTYIESLIYTSEDPIGIEEIQDALQRYTGELFTEDLLLTYIEQISEVYKANDTRIFHLVEIDSAYRFMTKAGFFPLIAAHLKNKHRKKLTKSALETLAIIAYKQPVTKPDIERIRGVNCDYSIQKLLEKELVSIMGRADSPGKPLLYGTSEKFMQHFGLKTINDLPQLKEIISADTAIGDPEGMDSPLLPNSSKLETDE